MGASFFDCVVARTSELASLFQTSADVRTAHGLSSSGRKSLAFYSFYRKISININILAKGGFHGTHGTPSGSATELAP